MATACRLCLSSTENHYEAVAAIEDKYFQLVLPEIDIHLVQSPMFCQSCVELLQTTYSFRSKCIETEKMLKLYTSNCGGGNLLLSDVLQNHFSAKYQSLSGNSDAEVQLDNYIKLECENDSFEYDLDLAGDDLQSYPENDIKPEEKRNTEVSLQLGLQQESSDDEDSKKLDYKRPFRCEDCGNSYRKKQWLIDHIYRHYEHPHCFTCDKDITTRYQLKCHLLKVHKIEMTEKHVEKVYTLYLDKEKLDECLRKHLDLYKWMVDVERVENSNSEDRPHKCNICKKAYNMKKYLLEHVRLHFTKSDCKICGKQFFSAVAVKRHLWKVHKTGRNEDKNWRDHITVTVDELEMKEAIKEHKLEETDDNDKNESDSYEDQLEVEDTSIASQSSRYVCEKCGKQFGTTSTFNRHKLTHNSKKYFICEHCQERFVTKVCLENHNSVCQRVSSKPKEDCNFTCNTCGKSIFHKSKFIEHMRKHASEKPYKCNLCDKAFAQRSSWASHKRKVHITERLFSCDYCNKSFTLQGVLSKHVKTVHMIDNIEKKFVCNYCGKKFLMLHLLNTHLKWHSSDWEYSCDVCERKFVDNSSVKKHRVTHFAKKHKCEICGKGFHQKYNIKVHMKVHCAVP